MVIDYGYGVVLHRLDRSDLEIVRKWRNDPKIAEYMQFKKHITFQEQIEWFESMNLEKDYYFIVTCQKEKIALTNLKNYNNEFKIAESGLFIGEFSFQNSLVAYSIGFTLFDFGFDKLGLENVIAHIMRHNRRAIRYNLSLGFKLQKNQEKYETQKYILKKACYYKCTNKYKKLVKNK